MILGAVEMIAVMEVLVSESASAQQQSVLWEVNSGVRAVGRMKLH